LGKFFGNEKPEFKGAIDRTGCQADAGDSALDCGVQTVPIVRRGGGFEGEKGGTQTVGQCCGAQNGSERIEIAPVLGLG